MRVDSHVHAFPDRLAQAVRDALNQGRTLGGGFLLPDVAEGVRAAGFDRAWVLPYAHRAGVAAGVNEWSALAVPRYPWLVAGATFHPDDEDIATLARRALIELGLRVVKLHCSVGRFSPADPRLEPLWRAAASEGTPIVIHAGQVGPGETAASELDALVPVLAAHPELRLVLAHSGHPATARALELIDRFDNLHGDVTPVGPNPVALEADDLRRFAGRFLFGSDAPNNFLPVAEQAARFEAMGLSEMDLDLLMGGAAARLIA